ncbi:MAG: TetR/AcrR family transcriptional regulator [Cellulomonadaceae bacterium]
MSRAQTFDTGAVVRAARDVFWSLGYDGASIPALEEATRLRRSSIYHAFGSKRGLFDAAVASYLDEVVRPRLRPLAAPAVPPEAVIRYLEGLRTALEQAGSFTATNGCLLVNAAGAPISQDVAVRETVAGYRAELRAALGRGIRARFPDRPDVDRLAEVCAGLVVSAFALTRVDNTAALQAVDTALELLEAG